MTAREYNFDGLVGPSHNYGGLSFGNIASEVNEGSSSNPRQAALQGLSKMRTLHTLGVPQAVFPPHMRPELSLARRMGFDGDDAKVLGEACLMAARVRHRTRYRHDHMAHDGHVIYVGQTEDDAALLDDDGRCVRVEQFTRELLDWVGDAPVLYKPHPLTGDFAEQERQMLERLLGRNVARCETDTYELLAGDDDVRFVALSSGVVQEAEWFGKPSAALFRPLYTPAFGRAEGPDEHLLVAAHDFLGEALWADVLDVPVRPGAFQPTPTPNHLRELHNTWWGYAAYALSGNVYMEEAFRRYGAAPAEAPKQ